MEFLSAKYDNLFKELEILKNERKNYNDNILELKNEIEVLERSSNATKLEIRNISKFENENKKSLSQIVIDIGQSLKLDIKGSDIRDVYRPFGKSDVVRPIIVDLNSVILKNDIVQSYRKLNKSGDKLNSSHIKMKGPTKLIFISECLTFEGKKIFYSARDFCRTNQFKF
ncbi:unnamed protein product [Diatraea saccharalis]|uniref:Uncharacterized protein n=1 Tax=Diatraea saccharalis TaxID=40085 RepID=A0A9N9RBF7_9NEOP|nr:unnamed protein product [Diatraea saccharalis]